jgi:DNA-binding protein YbaB
LAKAEQLQQRVGEITGTATSEDERITVSFNETTGVEELKLDPRVMRMPSEDLAAEIARLVNAARADAQAQIQVVLDETFGADGRPDPEEIGEQVAELQQSLDEMMGDTMRMDGELSSVLEQMRRLAGE